MDAAIKMNPALETSESPFGQNRGKVMMWVFIVSDALIFASLLVAYGFQRYVSPVWPDRWKIFEPGFICAMTVLLLSSSTTMAIAVEALKEGKKQLFALFYCITILAGFTFLGMQAFEWSHFIEKGASLTGNPWGVPMFSAFFFLITGFHGFHVMSGVLVLVLVGLWRMMGKASVHSIEMAGLYWSFVDLVWVFIFAFIYLA